MHIFILFIINHWVLFLALVVVIVLLSKKNTMYNAKGISKISPDDLVNLMNNNSAKVLDIRDDLAYGKEHIISSINIPYIDLAMELEKIEKYKNKLLVLVCYKGELAMKYAVMLKEKGFQKISILSGGIAQWKKVGLITEESPSKFK